MPLNGHDLTFKSRVLLRPTANILPSLHMPITYGRYGIYFLYFKYFGSHILWPPTIVHKPQWLEYLAYDTDRKRENIKCYSRGEQELVDQEAGCV